MLLCIVCEHYTAEFILNFKEVALSTDAAATKEYELCSSHFYQSLISNLQQYSKFQPSNVNAVSVGHCTVGGIPVMRLNETVMTPSYAVKMQSIISSSYTVLGCHTHLK